MESNLFTKEENIGFWKNMALAVVFFTIAPVTLAISLFSLFSLKTSSLSNLMESRQTGFSVYAPLTPHLTSVSNEVTASDARSEIIRQYLSFYSSPLAQYSDLIVSTADKYALDYRLITAIAQQESNLCKNIPDNSFNCWGWGITGKDSLEFTSYQQGIENVSKGLRENYLNKGLVTVPDIMSKYNPGSSGSWADGVSQFVSEMQ